MAQALDRRVAVGRELRRGRVELLLRRVGEFVRNRRQFTHGKGLKIHGTEAVPVQQSDRVALAQHRASWTVAVTFGITRATVL